MPHPYKVSVIVAVYNAERTLCRCLDSLAAQTLDSIEFLCIDDGSTDTTPSILDSYSSRDSRFKVFHKKNEGVSATRQFGIEHACGDYVIHLDSDDYVESYAYQSLYEAATSDRSEGPADLVICNAYRITNGGIQIMDYSDEDLSAKHLVERMFSWETSALWNRLVKTDLIERYHLSFPAYLQLAEDRYFLACLLNRSIQNHDSLRIVHVDKALVHYDNVANPSSLTRPSDSIKDILQLLTHSYLLLIDELDMAIFGEKYFSFISQMAFTAYWRFKKNDLSSNDYANMFLPFRAGIKRYVPNSFNKFLVLLSLRIGVSRAYSFRWLALPPILIDKIKRIFSS